MTRTSNSSFLVSIVMPVYNGEQFITEAINSVLVQTHLDWEMIIVNDGSTDGTAEIAGDFKDPRISLIHQENLGLAAARNAGIRATEGEFLAFLDSDDVWTPQFLERCITTVQDERDLAGVYTYNYHIDQNGIRLPGLGAQLVPPEELYDKLLEGGFFPPCTALVRRNIVEQVGLFDTGLQGQGTEDWDLWLRITRRYLIRCVPVPLASYRVYPGSMATNAAKMHLCRISVLRKHLGILNGEPGSWPLEKRRAYGFAYRAATFDFIAQGKRDEGWHYFSRAIKIYPGLLRRLDTFYELALGEQPKGYRGQANLLDIEANGGEMIDFLDTILVGSPPQAKELRGPAFGNAYLALAMLSDQAGDWALARGYLHKAARANPDLLRAPLFGRRYVKLLLGRRIAGGVRRIGLLWPSLVTNN